MRVRETIAQGLRLLWWISLVWLTVSLLGESWWFARYLADRDNPARNELVIGAVVFLFYSWPAAVGMLVAALVPRTGLSIQRRLIGVALLICCITLTYLFK